MKAMVVGEFPRFHSLKHESIVNKGVFVKTDVWKPYGLRMDFIHTETPDFGVNNASYGFVNGGLTENLHF